MIRASRQSAGLSANIVWTNCLSFISCSLAGCRSWDLARTCPRKSPNTSRSNEKFLLSARALPGWAKSAAAQTWILMTKCSSTFTTSNTGVHGSTSSSFSKHRSWSYSEKGPTSASFHFDQKVNDWYGVCMKIALVHDYLAQDGGAEKVLEAMQE